MTYRSLLLPRGAPRPRIHIELDPARSSFTDEETVEPDVYDVDGFGHDDGHDPDPEHAFRLVFTLGRGYTIHRYVIGMTRPDDPRFFHRFDVTDCAVAEIDEQSLGPPERVRCDAIDLPVVFARADVSLGGDPCSFAVERVTFRAFHDGGQRWIATWRSLHPSEDAGSRSLVFEHPGGWSLVRGGEPRSLVSGDRVRFAEPTSRR